MAKVKAKSKSKVVEKEAKTAYESLCLPTKNEFYKDAIGINEFADSDFIRKVKTALLDIEKFSNVNDEGTSGLYVNSIVEASLIGLRFFPSVTDSFWIDLASLMEDFGVNYFPEFEKIFEEYYKRSEVFIIAWDSVGELVSLSDDTSNHIEYSRRRIAEIRDRLYKFVDHGDKSPTILDNDDDDLEI